MALRDVLEKNFFSKEDIVFLLKLSSPVEIGLLLKKANTVRNETIGEGIKIIGSIKISNHCEESCIYCPKRKENLTLDRYRFTAEKIIETVKRYSYMGLKEIMIRSCADSHFDSDLISYIIYSIKQNNDITLTLSLCERDFDEYKNWHIAGADRYIIKHITSNPVLFSKYHNGNKIENRIEHLKKLRSIGFKTGSGSIIGLPYQNEEDIAQDILLCRKLGVNMLTLNSFIPSNNVPCHNEKELNEQLVLKAVAAARLALRDIDISIYPAFGRRDLSLKKKMLNGGANLLSINFDLIRYPLDLLSDADKVQSLIEIFSSKKTKGLINSIL